VSRGLDKSIEMEWAFKAEFLCRVKLQSFLGVKIKLLAILLGDL